MASLSIIICQFLIFISFSYASFTTTIDPKYGEPNAMDNAQDNNLINTISSNEESISNSSSKSGFHLPFEHKQLLAWIIGGLFVWCSIIICCVLFVKRSIYYHNKTKSNQHKMNISNMMGQIDNIEYHHAGRYNNENNHDHIPNGNVTVIEEEEDDNHHEHETFEQEEIINQVKNMEKKRMSKTDKLVQELKLRHLGQKQGKKGQDVILEMNINNHGRQPSSPVTNPVEYVRTPPPPPPPGIAGVDYMGNVVPAPQPPPANQGQTYTNPNPGY